MVPRPCGRKLILNQKLNSFEMNFMKELSLNDNVVIHENLSEESTTFSITKEIKPALLYN
jgi:hypothetical protein